jgi:hypothetical protein
MESTGTLTHRPISRMAQVNHKGVISAGVNFSVGRADYWPTVNQCEAPVQKTQN